MPFEAIAGKDEVHLNYKYVKRTATIRTACLAVLSFGVLLLGVTTLILASNAAQDRQESDCRSDINGRVTVLASEVGVAHARGALAAYLGKADEFVEEQAEIVERKEPLLQDALDDRQNADEICGG